MVPFPVENHIIIQFYTESTEIRLFKKNDNYVFISDIPNTPKKVVIIMIMLKNLLIELAASLLLSFDASQDKQILLGLKLARYIQLKRHNRF